jgi:hypothetical protein
MRNLTLARGEPTTRSVAFGSEREPHKTLYLVLLGSGALPIFSVLPQSSADAVCLDKHRLGWGALGSAVLFRRILASGISLQYRFRPPLGSGL